VAASPPAQRLLAQLSAASADKAPDVSAGTAAQEALAEGAEIIIGPLFAPAVQAGADAVLAASVFHFGELTIAEVKAAMAAEGITVR
jgi:predicted phage tail protein